MDAELAERVLRHHLELASRIVEEYKESIAEDPAWALSSSDSFLEKAAMQEVATRFLHILEARGLGEVRGILLRQILLDASRKGASTSTTSNLMDKWRLAAQAEIYLDLFKETL